MSKQEQTTWAAFIIEGLVLYYYVSNLLGLPDLLDIYSIGMAWLIIKVIVISIILAIAGEVVLYLVADENRDLVEADERDHMINAKASRNAYYFVIIGVVILIGQIVVSQAWGLGLAERGIEMTPILIAHILLLLMILAGFVKYGTRLFYYRRGY